MSTDSTYYKYLNKRLVGAVRRGNIEEAAGIVQIMDTLDAPLYRVTLRLKLLWSDDSEVVEADNGVEAFPLLAWRAQVVDEIEEALGTYPGAGVCHKSEANHETPLLEVEDWDFDSGVFYVYATFFLQVDIPVPEGETITESLQRILYDEGGVSGDFTLVDSALLADIKSGQDEPKDEPH